MRIKNEYLLSADRFKRPKSRTDKDAIGLLLMRLILMDPGTNPLHPDMGVGIRNWRYTMGSLEELRKRTQNQIDTYLPQLTGATVIITTNPDKTCNIEISVEDMIYVYDSAQTSYPISLSDIINE